MQGSGKRPWQMVAWNTGSRSVRGTVTQKEALNAQGSSSSGNQEADWPSRDTYRNSSQGCPRLGRP